MARGRPRKKQQPDRPKQDRSGRVSVGLPGGPRSGYGFAVPFTSLRNVGLEGSGPVEREPEHDPFETWRARGTFTQIVLGYPEGYRAEQPKVERWAFVKP